MEGADIELHQPSAPAFLPGEHESGRIWKLAEIISHTDFVPRSLRGNPPAIMAAMLTGRELGIMPMRALRQVNIIEGQPTPSPELMMALALKAGHDVDVVETSRTKCVVEVHRKGWPDDKVRRLEWTIEDAEAAGLCEITDDGKVRARSNKGNPLPWESYTRAMLRSRAVSEACRTWLPDVVDGASYVPEELGAPVTGQGHAVELVDAARARGEDYDPLEGESEEVRAKVGEAMGYDQTDDVVDAELVTNDPEPAPDACTACGEIIAGEHDCGDGWGPEITQEPPPDEDAEPVSEAEPFDWRAHAEEAGVNTVALLKALREAWPNNDRARQPNRTKDIDRIAADDTLAPWVKVTIDDLAGGS